MFRRFTHLLLLTFAVFLLGGCATVHPPANPVDPVTVYVADYGVHSAVMLPVGRNRFVEYAFGDWGYCAEDRDGPFDSVGALLVSQSSALGRRYIDLKPGDPYPMPKVELPKTVFPVAVPRATVVAVEQKLAARYHRSLCSIVYNPGNDTDYVRDTEHYSVLHSCNGLTASELTDMGCKVNGWAIWSRFRLAGDAPPVQVQANPVTARVAPLPAATPSVATAGQ
jgi:hypothetical protein